MNTNREHSMTFDQLPHLAFFFLKSQDDVCQKISITEARDASCAPGWCFEVKATEVVDLAIPKSQA